MSGEAEREEDRMLAAEYALGLLTSDADRAFEARLAGDPDLRANYAIWADDFASLLADLPPMAPPPSVKAAITATLFPEERQSIWRRLGLFPALAGALVAALIVLVATNWGVLGTFDPTLVAEIAAEDQSLVVQASFVAETGVMQVAVAVGAALPGRVLELWLIAGDAAPVSLGLITAGQVTEITLPAAQIAVRAGAVLAISDEPPGGSTTGAPTGAVLAVGPVVDV